jgi:hypothetical protein
LEVKVEIMDSCEYARVTGRHRATAVDRRDLKNALKDLMDQINYSTIPFLDSDLTEGIINLIVKQCHKICRREDLNALVPGLNHSTQLEIMDIVSSIFMLKNLDSENH